MVRKATEKDIPAAMELFTAAKSIMRSDGNSTQWGDGYPDAGIVRTDISMGGAHIIEQDGKPVAYFALLPSPEPTYSSIDGKWLDDSSPYHVIHRIASTPESHGVFRRIIEYALSVSGNLRIDTHRDNRIMRRLIEKAGFSYCGVIVLADGSERLAYQKNHTAMNLKRIFLLTALALGAATLSPAQIYPQEELHFRAPAVPKQIIFAGDTIRFDRSDLYERMDRELISFTYMHSNSILMLKKSDRYFRMVEPILRQNGIPDDLKYLMAIESNLNPKAYSSAGAAGLWQFTKTTGKEYGLIIDAEVDERYNIEKETVAACKYLRRAYEKYGDWMTVAASYNAGQGGISRRLSDQRQKSALDLWMVEETSRYMFRVLSAKMFFETPAAFGFNVNDFEKYPCYSPKEVVTVSGAIASLVDFAEEHGVTYYQLKEANLWLRDNKLLNKAGHTYKIIIPSGK